MWSFLMCDYVVTGGTLGMGKTSSAVKQKYNDKTYTAVNVSIRKELVACWADEIAKDGISKAEFVRNAMLKYLNEKGIDVGALNAEKAQD